MNTIRGVSVRSGKGAPFPLTLSDVRARQTRALVDRQEDTVGWAADSFLWVADEV